MQKTTATNDILEQVLGKVQAKGPDSRGWYTALCPFHADKNRPNLRFQQTGFRCMACGEHGNLEKLAYKLGIQPAQKTRTPSHIVRTYDYRDEKNNLLFQVVRVTAQNLRFLD
ncbi:CHC2 zinc finger domain-containing protein [Chloroflexota bacterium]